MAASFATGCRALRTSFRRCCDIPGSTNRRPYRWFPVLHVTTVTATGSELFIALQLDLTVGFAQNRVTGIHLRDGQETAKIQTGSAIIRESQTNEI